MSAVRAFPWASLDQVTREDVEAARTLGRLVGSPEIVERAAITLEKVVGARVGLRQHRVLVTAPPPDERAIAVLLDVSGARVVVDAEPTLALDLVSRALSRPQPGAVDPDNGFALAATSGAFGAILVRALRVGRDDADVTVLAAGRAHAIAAQSGIVDPAAVVFTVLVDADAYRVRVLFSRRKAFLVARDATAHADRRALEQLRDVPLEVPLVLGVGWSTAREIEGLAPGDVWLPSGMARPSAGPLALLLAARASTRGLAATLEEDGRLVLGSSVEDMIMSDAGSDTLLESALEAPVVVRVEIGVLELPAREWAALKPGDVVTTGTRVGQEVILRAGGAELGRGELVDVDGEVGVRIASIGKGR